MIEKRSDKGTARLTGNISYPAQLSALLIKQANYAREENGSQSMIVVVYGEGKKGTHTPVVWPYALSNAVLFVATRWVSGNRKWILI